MAHERLDAAPPWRQFPFRIFFPLGMLIAWAGVLHWLLYATGLSPRYLSIFHAMAQVQGFLMCFAVGFLFTAIPRRTGTWPPAAWEMGLAMVAPIGTTIGAWFQDWSVAQGFWLVLAAVLVQFAVRRFSSGGAVRRPPTSFVWIPLSVLVGLVGSVLTGAGAALGTAWWGMHVFGSGLVLQGMFIGLVLGAGSLIVPMITRGEAPPDWPPGSRGALALSGHVLGVALLVASFLLEARSQTGGAGERIAHALRGGVALVFLLRVGGIWRPPSLPGWNRWLVWIAAWLVPMGFLAVAALPAARKSLLHVSFVGGFALLAFSVAAHVIAAHGSRPELITARPKRLAAMGALFLTAAALRSLVELDPGPRFTLWLGAAAIAFLLGTLAWASFVGPILFAGSPGED